MRVRIPSFRNALLVNSCAGQIARAGGGGNVEKETAGIQPAASHRSSIPKLSHRFNGRGEAALVARALFLWMIFLSAIRSTMPAERFSACFATSLSPAAIALFTSLIASALSSAGRRCGAAVSRLGGNACAPNLYWPW